MSYRSLVQRSRAAAVCGVLFFSLLVVACRNGETAQPPATEGVPAGTPFESLGEENAAPPVAVASSTPPPAEPTPTPQLAATVNGQPIYQHELDRAVAQRNEGLQGVIDPDLAESEAEELVLEMLIEQVLISQAAAANGLTVTDEMLAAEMAELRRLAEEAGGAGGYEAWLQANGWTEEELAMALRQQLLTEQVMAFVTADVAEAVPQAHARYLQVDDGALAQSLRDQVEAGADFASLARQHSLDRATGEDGGDLGYFPAGVLLVPEVEAAAFALQPGEVSEVIAVADESGGTTYYLVQLIEIDPARPLDAATRAVLLQERFESWLAEQWAEAEIVRYGEG